MAVREQRLAHSRARKRYQAAEVLQAAEQGLETDPAATALLLRVSRSMAQKLALPGGPLQQASHDPATHALSDLGLLSELVIQAFQQEEQPLSRALHREQLLRLRGERALAELLESHGGTLQPAEVSARFTPSSNSI